ncbi:MAG: universal stress protein [Streptomyces sp.]|nr:universal stress protein [Streptomyces sp.]
MILVGVDGAEVSRAALRRAARQAELTGAQLRAVQAWRLPATYGMPAEYADTDFGKQTRERANREYFAVPTLRHATVDGTSEGCQRGAGEASGFAASDGPDRAFLPPSFA